MGPAVAEERREDPGPERVCGRCAPGSAAARARAGFRRRSTGQTQGLINDKDNNRTKFCLFWCLIEYLQA